MLENEPTGNPWVICVPEPCETKADGGSLMGEDWRHSQLVSVGTQAARHPTGHPTGRQHNGTRRFVSVISPIPQAFIAYARWDSAWNIAEMAETVSRGRT